MTTPNVLQRAGWFGEPKRMDSWWTLRKLGHEARCEMYLHQFGWELRLEVDDRDLTRTQVCRSQEEVLSTQESWRAMLEEKGWQ